MRVRPPHGRDGLHQESPEGPIHARAHALLVGDRVAKVHVAGGLGEPEVVEDRADVGRTEAVFKEVLLR